MGFLDDVIDNAGEPYKGGKGFEYGTHEVMIGSAAAVQKKVQKNDSADVIEVEVFDEADNDKTATATLYFHTEGGAKMSVTKVLGIMIHNVGEEKKDKVRAAAKKLFAGVGDDPKKAREVVLQLMNDKFVGKYKAFLVVEPRGTYKTSSYGDLWHYAAEPENAAPADEAVVAGGTDITNTPEGEDIPDFDDL